MRDDDALLRRYLLGELDAEEENRLEARLLQDDGLFERAEAMEADLLDEHAGGGLSAAQRARLQRHLASSPATRSQLAVVQGLGAVAREERPAYRVLTGPWGKTDLSRPSVRALAAAAMIAIAVLSVGIARIFVPLPEERARIAEEAPAAPAPPRPQALPPAMPGTLAELTPTAVPPTSPISPISPAISTPPATPAPLVPRAVISQVFEVALTTLRGPGDGGMPLSVSSGTERVDLHLLLSPGDDVFPSYQAVLRDTTGAELVRRMDLQPVKAGEKAVLVLPVEAKQLQAGLYEVDVKGVSAEGDVIDLGYPQFQVAGPEMNSPP